MTDPMRRGSVLEYGVVSDRYVADPLGRRGVQISPALPDGTAAVVVCATGVLEAWSVIETTRLHVVPEEEWP